jgi:hypothetical protein
MRRCLRFVYHSAPVNGVACGRDRTEWPSWRLTVRTTSVGAGSVRSLVAMNANRGDAVSLPFGEACARETNHAGTG